MCIAPVFALALLEVVELTTLTDADGRSAPFVLQAHLKSNQNIIGNTIPLLSP